MPVREPLSRCGALVIDSMPPATTARAEPALMMSWASITAFMPEPQTLLMVVQPAASGMPAARDAWRAGAWPRPAGSTQPMMTSSTLSAARPDWASAAEIAAAPSAGVGVPVNWPRKEPMAVRLAPTMTTSLMACSGLRGDPARGREAPIMARNDADCCAAAWRRGHVFGVAWACPDAVQHAAGARVVRRDAIR